MENLHGDFPGPKSSVEDFQKGRFPWKSPALNQQVPAKQDGPPVRAVREKVGS
jgi:hypothetical protein